VALILFSWGFAVTKRYFFTVPLSQDHRMFEVGRDLWNWWIDVQDCCFRWCDYSGLSSE